MAVRFTEPRFHCVGGVPLDELDNIDQMLGGVADYYWSKFLAPAIELELETEITSIFWETLNKSSNWLGERLGTRDPECTCLTI